MAPKFFTKLGDFLQPKPSPLQPKNLKIFSPISCTSHGRPCTHIGHQKSFWFLGWGFLTHSATLSIFFPLKFLSPFFLSHARPLPRNWVQNFQICPWFLAWNRTCTLTSLPWLFPTFLLVLSWFLSSSLSRIFLQKNGKSLAKFFWFKWLNATPIYRQMQTFKKLHFSP